MTLPNHISEWWGVANDRRIRLINKKHRTSKGLTLAQENEYKLLQAVAEEIINYADRAAKIERAHRSVKNRIAK